MTKKLFFFFLSLIILAVILTSVWLIFNWRSVGSVWSQATTAVKSGGLSGWHYAQLAGLIHPRTYLVILQNNHELRPTGGFIGAYAIVKVAAGKVTDFQLSDSYALDRSAEAYLRVEPPAPIKEYLTDAWWFRDANWSPDWPVAAETLTWFYQQEGGQEKIDGVIGLDQRVISDLLTVVGPLTVDDLTFDAENLTDLLQAEVEENYQLKGIPKEQRKAIIGRLGQELLARLDQLSVADWLKVFKLFSQALAEKHLLFYDYEPKLQDFFLTRGWAGQIASATNDYLAVIDANLAARKTDRVVVKTIDYLVQQNSAGELIAILTLTYDHQGQHDYRTSRLRTFTRVYAPLGSELIAVRGARANDRQGDGPGQPVVGQELDKTVFGAFWYLEPGEKRSLIFEYRLPATVLTQLAPGELYKIFVQKQPGTTGHAFNFRVKLGGQSGELTTVLTTDQRLTLSHN